MSTNALAMEQTHQSFLVRTISMLRTTVAVVAAALAILAVASYFELSQAQEFRPVDVAERSGVADHGAGLGGR